MLTNAFLIDDIEETIKPNPEVPIRALKDQLQKKYQLRVTNNKIYRAKAKASLIPWRLAQELLWNCACATSMPYFEKHMDKLRKTDVKAYEWLNKIPPQHWSRAHFSVFNRQLVDGRDVPISTCLEFFREYLMKRIVKVQQVIDKSKGPLTPAAAALFKAITDEASFYKNGDNLYQVMGPYNDQCVVDVKEKTCSYRKWDLTGMPCKHAVAALWDRAGNKSDVGTPESWVHACYWLVTWKKIGRPPKKRKKSVDELSSHKMTSGGKLSRIGKIVTCDTCKKPGYNKRSCKKGVEGSQPSQMSAATPTASQASAARGPQRFVATSLSSQRFAANQSASQRRFDTSPRSSQRSTTTPRASQMSAANAKGKEKV
ncbi:mutator type transposase [Tanacetum coccineum]